MFTDTVRSFMDYGFDVCTAVMSLTGLQREKLREEALEEVYYQVEIPLIIVMASMEAEGFKADRETLQQFGEMLSEKIDEITARVTELAGESFNLNSPAAARRDPL